MLQTALVTGVTDSLPDAPSTERDHRIKIQFHWQRGSAPNSGGYDSQAITEMVSAPGTDTSQGVTIKDLPKAKRRVLEEILRAGLENVADVDLDNFVLVRLKQFAASLMFEFIDNCLDWASPLKAEVTFGPARKYTDHACEGTRLKRVGKVSPFYPFPPPNNRRGSIAADLIINEYRKKPTGKANIFAIVEIKFEGDKIDAEQFKQYRALLDRAAKEKTKQSPVRFDKRPVSEGGRLSLFRYPLDKSVEKGKDEKKHRKSGKNGKR